MPLCNHHCYHRTHTGPKTIMYRCCQCHKGKRRYRPGCKPPT